MRVKGKGRAGGLVRIGNCDEAVFFALHIPQIKMIGKWGNIPCSSLFYLRLRKNK